MDIKNIDKSLLQTLVRQIIEEKINGTKDTVDFVRNKDICGTGISL